MPKDEQLASCRVKIPPPNACLAELVFSGSDTWTGYLPPLGHAVRRCAHYESEVEVGHLKIQLLPTASNVGALSWSRARVSSFSRGQISPRLNIWPTIKIHLCRWYDRASKLKPSSLEKGENPLLFLRDPVRLTELLERSFVS